MFVQEYYVNQALRLKDGVIRETRTVRMSAIPTVVPSQPSAYGSQDSLHNKLQWQYFNEMAYVDKTRLSAGDDAYARNKFNQVASDALMSNREIPDSRHPL